MIQLNYNPSLFTSAGKRLGLILLTLGLVACGSSSPSPVKLGDAGDFAILAKAGISSVPMSTVKGDIGVSPAEASYITGFSLDAEATAVFSGSTQVSGQIYAANYAAPTPSNLTIAVSHMERAYTDAAGRDDPDHTELGAGNIGGKTLEPGLYKWSSTVSIPTSVTLSGSSSDKWIFQTSKDLTMASGQKVILKGGAQAKNIVWQVAGEVTIGSTSHFEGIILSKTAVTLLTGATMNGRILAQTQVNLHQATVIEP